MAEMLDRSIWTGRTDPEPDALRWHQVVQPLNAEVAPGIVLFGFASDAGVVRNKGRSGARNGPTSIRRMAANLSWHGEVPVYDGGDVVCGPDDEGDALETAQAALGQHITAALDVGHRPIALGGGHAIAFASWQGVARHLADREMRPRVGIINLDAHFDLRDPGEVRSSGTPFSQIADDCTRRGWDFAYACLGVARASNTATLYRCAEKLGVLIHEDRDFERQPEVIHENLQQFIAGCDHLYLTIDLDGLPACETPGVSAPAARGVTLARLEPLIDLIRDSGKLRLADIAEMNPDYDIDNRTARLAARLLHQLANQS